MGNRVTIILGAGAVLDFDHKGIFPSVKNIIERCLNRASKKWMEVKDRSCVSYMTILLGN